MKKDIAKWFVLVLVMLLLFSACSGAPTSNPTDEDHPVEMESPEQPEDIKEQEQTDPGPRSSPLKMAPDFSLSDGKGNMVNLAEQFQEYEQVVLVFYYGTSCQPCMAQLSQISNDQLKYDDKGAQVIAIAVQDEKAAERTANFIDARFPVLADQKHMVAKAFGVLENAGLSHPSVFIINPDFSIAWSEITYIEGGGCGKERVPSQTILDNLG